MTRLRRDTHDTIPAQPQAKSLRIVASGTLFLTHRLSVPNYPVPTSVVRAHTVERARGGSANLVLSLLAQFPSVEPLLLAPLSGNEEGQLILKDLEKEGVNIRYCKIWKNAGVPTAWIIDSAEDEAKSVINHNPLPDITHEEFVSLLGPLLAPENYPDSPLNTPPIPHYAHSHSPSPHPSSPVPRSSISTLHPGPPPQLFNPNSPAPFDWLHFEGRSVKTTMSNMTGLDGLARERKWRSHCVFSIDVGRKGKQGVEALIPYADVLFLNKWYAEEVSEHYATSPRAFLLSMTSVAPPHALLVAHWGKDGAAVLSLPTKEYFQSSGWVEEQNNSEAMDRASRDMTEMRSVRSGSEFWADGLSHTRSSSAFYSFGYTSDAGAGTVSSPNPYDRPRTTTIRGRDGRESQDISSRSRGTPPDGVVDEVGAQEAFIAGMIFALSRRLMPGSPYTPSWSGEEADGSSAENERGRWRLDECLRFATELAGRKARRRTWDGLAEEMTQAGWFEG